MAVSIRCWCRGVLAGSLDPAGVIPFGRPGARDLVEFSVLTCVADKSLVDFFGLVPWSPPGDDETAVMAALLASLEQMVSRNHRPSSCLLVRLTDGRVKMVASPEGTRQAREEALRIRNEYGPFSAAFSIQVADGPSGISFAVENLAGGQSPCFRAREESIT